MKSFFSREQFTNAYSNGIASHYWIISRNKFILDLLNTKGLNKSDKILDIGCGIGIVLDYLRNNNINCYGIEPSSIEINQELKPYIFIGQNIESLSNDFRASINKILLLDVLEHISNPIEFLSQLKILFPNLEQLIITVPAHSELWSNYDLYYGHYKRYNQDILEKELLESGFKNISIYPIFTLLYWPLRLYILIFKKRSIYIKPPNYKYFHKIIYYIITKFNKFLKRGTSIISVANINRNISIHKDN